MTAAAHLAQPDLTELLALINAALAQYDLAAQAQLIEEFDLPFYVVVKYRKGDSAALDWLQQHIVQPWITAHAASYQVHRNNNNLAVLPRTLGKEHAVRYLIKRFSHEWGELLTFGVGDSLSDGAFMAECDYSIVPCASQLFSETLKRITL
jgi:phosphoserine phosphatase